MDKYTLVFISVFDSQYSTYVIALALFAIVIYLIIRYRTLQNKTTKVYYKVLLAFLLFFLYNIYSEIKVTNIAETTLQSNKYMIIEGEVANYHPSQTFGRVEDFNVGNIHFVISPKGSHRDKIFYSDNKNKKLIQANGQKVKIYYIKDPSSKFCIPLTNKCFSIGERSENKIIKMWIVKRE